MLLAKQISFIVALTLRHMINFQTTCGAEYGVDCSFPIHSKEWKCGDLLGDRKNLYESFMEGCRKKYGKQGFRCDLTEDDRIEMSRRQPMSMVNYTDTGFKKIRAPKQLMDLLLSHWNANNHNEVAENWGAGNTYVNHWESPTYMTSVEDNRLRGGGQSLKKKIWDAAKTTIEEWTQMEQKPTSMYGIRKYTTGAILSPHADRLPLVSSCIVNVAQDVDEPWPLEVIDRQGRAVNVTMEPGDMVLYESGSLIHARPFPLKGKYFANIFIHFEPTGRKLGDTSMRFLDELDDFYPPYLLKGSPELSNWKSRNPGGWKQPSPAAMIHETHSPEAHAAAAIGDVMRLALLGRKDKTALTKKDINGWQPIHEAARGGHTDVIKLLVEHGADVNDCTGHGNGSGFSPLDIATEALGVDHSIVHYLIGLGGASCSEEL
jgi:prolyl 4-hydroxylase